MHLRAQASPWPRAAPARVSPQLRRLRTVRARRACPDTTPQAVLPRVSLTHILVAARDKGTWLVLSRQTRTARRALRARFQRVRRTSPAKPTAIKHAGQGPGLPRATPRKMMGAQRVRRENTRAPRATTCCAVPTARPTVQQGKSWLRVLPRSTRTALTTSVRAARAPSPQDQTARRTARYVPPANPASTYSLVVRAASVRPMSAHAPTAAKRLARPAQRTTHTPVPAARRLATVGFTSTLRTASARPTFAVALVAPNRPERPVLRTTQTCAPRVTRASTRAATRAWQIPAVAAAARNRPERPVLRTTQTCAPRVTRASTRAATHA